MSHRDSWLTLAVRRDSASQLVRSSSLGWRDEAALRREILRAVPSQLPGKGLPSAAAKLRGRAEAAAEAADRSRSNGQKHRRGQGAALPGEAEGAADPRKWRNNAFARALILTRQALRTPLLNPCMSLPLA